jgi:hypothetical protein
MKKLVKKTVKKSIQKSLTVDQKLDFLINENKKLDERVYTKLDFLIEENKKLYSLEKLALENQDTIHFIKDYVVKEFERVDDRFNEMQEVLLSHSDVARVNKIELQIDVQAVRAEIADIKRELEDLAVRTRSMQGYSVDIDDLRSRVMKVESMFMMMTGKKVSQKLQTTTH